METPGEVLPKEPDGERNRLMHKSEEEMKQPSYNYALPGNNSLTLCKAALMEVLQVWVDTFFPGTIISDINQTDNSFKISLTDRQL